MPTKPDSFHQSPRFVIWKKMNKPIGGPRFRSIDGSNCTPPSPPPWTTNPESNHAVINAANLVWLGEKILEMRSSWLRSSRTARSRLCRPAASSVRFVSIHFQFNRRCLIDGGFGGSGCRFQLVESLVTTVEKQIKIGSFWIELDTLIIAWFELMFDGFQIVKSIGGMEGNRQGFD